MFRIDGQRRRVLRDIPGQFPHRPARLRPDAEGLRSVESAPRFPTMHHVAAALTPSSPPARRPNPLETIVVPDGGGYSRGPNSDFVGAPAGIGRVIS